MLDLRGLSQAEAATGVATAAVATAADAAVRKRGALQRKNMARVFKRFPALIPPAAGMAFSHRQPTQAAPLLTAQTMLPSRIQTAYTSKLIAQQTGVPTQLTDTAAPAAIQSQSTPEGVMRNRGVLPGAGVCADMQSPWQNGRRNAMGVRVVPSDGQE